MILIVVAIGLLINIPSDSVDISSDYHPWEEIDLESDEEIISYSDDELSEFVNAPLDINIASYEELLVVPGMTREIATAIVQRRSIKAYKSIEELRYAEGITPDNYTILSKCLCIGKTQKSSWLFRQRVGKEIEKSRGYSNGIFLGNPYFTLSKIHFYQEVNEHRIRIEGGAIFEKDAAEQLKYGNRKYYLATEYIPTKTYLISGSFLVHAGEGLIFGNRPYSTNTSFYSALTIPKKANIRPWLSSNEGMCMNGVAVRYLSRFYRIIGLYSNQYYNGTIQNDTIVTSIDKTGRFRTYNDIQRWITFQEKMYGGIIEVPVSENYYFGITFQNTTYNRWLFIKQSDEFIKRNILYSAYTSLDLDQCYVSLETAFTKNRKNATVGRIRYNLFDNCIVSFLYRKYPNVFVSFYSDAPSSTTIRDSENGFTISSQIAIFRKTIVNTMYDSYTVRDNLFGLLLPYQIFGNDLDLTLGSKVNLLIKYRYKEGKSISKKEDEYGREISYLSPNNSQRLRLSFSYAPQKNMQLVSRIDGVKVKTVENNDNEYGLTFSQTLRYSIMNCFVIESRATVFETDSYRSRIYNYETDLPGYSKSIALYEDGLRWYILFRCNITNNFSFAFKYSTLWKDGKTFLGSGDDRIDSATLSQVLLQVDCSFK